MTATVAQIWRHPIKAIGAEPLETVELTEGRPLPLDRAFAVLEQGGDESLGWRSCRNFLRGAKGPGLMAVTAHVEGAALTLSHPAQPDLKLDLGQPNEGDLFAWLSAIYPEERAGPQRLERAPKIGMADAPFASVSVMNLSSLRAVSQKAGQDLDSRRFRGNIWLDGLAPWEEFDLVGKTLHIGGAALDVVEPIVRCRATEANPATGNRDLPMLQILEQGWGHTEFGVNCRVTTSGVISVSDKVTVQ